jgi:hypothetical protein
MNRTLRPSTPFAASLVMATAALAMATAAQAASITGPASGHQGLPLFRLVRTAAPTAFVSKALSAGGAAAMAPEGRRLVSRDAHGVLHAYADSQTGDAQIFPDITPSRGAASHVAPADVATTVFSRFDIIPKDATTIRLGATTGVYGASASRGANDTTVPKSGAQLLFT